MELATTLLIDNGPSAYRICIIILESCNIAMGLRNFRSHAISNLQIEWALTLSWLHYHMSPKNNVNLYGFV